MGRSPGVTAIRFRGGQDRKVNDGDQFHIVEIEDTVVA